VLDIFAADDSSDGRVRALFGCPDDDRVCTVLDSSISRQLPLKREPPTLAWWQSVWTANVVPGTRDDIPVGWSVARDVAWRPWTVAYFADATHEAVDFALMVGDAGGCSKQFGAAQSACASEVQSNCAPTKICQ
jgi:hypothetical protein